MVYVIYYRRVDVCVCVCVCVEDMKVLYFGFVYEVIMCECT